MKLPRPLFVLLVCVLPFASCNRDLKNNSVGSRSIQELNQAEIRKGDRTIALTGATLIDGKGGDPVANSLVVVRSNTIEFAGESRGGNIPDGAEVVDLMGLTLLPGLIDAHYHDEDSDTLT